MTTPTAIARAFAAAAGRIDGVRSTFDHEPDISHDFPLPAVTMLWTGFTQDDRETGAYTDNTWDYDINVYIPLELGFEQAQLVLPEIVVRLLTIVREDPALSGLTEWLTISDGGPPTFITGERSGYLQKTLRLTASTSER